MWVGQAEDVQRPLYGSPWSLLCSSCFILQSVFYTRSKVYWERMGSVLWPAARAKGIERKESFCGQKRLCILLDFSGLCLISQLFRPTSPTSFPASWSSTSGPSHLPLSELDSQHLGASSYSGSQVSLHLPANFAAKEFPRNLISLLLYSHFKAKVLQCTNV